MKKVVFLTTHLCSGMFELREILNKNPRIDMRGRGGTYLHPSDLADLYGLGHKLLNSAAIYGDFLSYNHDLQSKAFYPICKFVYFIRPAKPTLNEIVNFPKTPYSYETAYRYYIYRLRRICEMAKRTPQAMLLTHQNLMDGKGLDELGEFLELKEPLEMTEKFVDYDQDVVPGEIIEKAEDSYEGYLYYLRQLKHLVKVNP